MSMEESGGDELRPKSTPAMALATAKNGKLEHRVLKKNKPSKAREEGELTSSDEDALPVCSGVPLSVTSAPSSNCVPNAPVRTNSQNVRSGKSVSTNFPAGSVDIRCRMPIQSGHKGDFFKKQAPFRSSRPGWNAPFSTNNNLVISFSDDDDDSGSDTDQQRQEKAPVTNVNRHMINSSKKPPDLPSVKLERATRNAGRVPPKKGSLSRTFVSSMSKVHGANPRSVGSSIDQQRSCSKNSNSVIKGVASQDRQYIKSGTVSDSKLQDLRQQIAIRENELKLKTVQQNKENLLEACKDSNIMNYSSTAPSKGREMSAEVQFGPKEPERKRLKLAQSNPVQSSSGDLEELPLKSTLVMKNPVLEKTGLHCRSVTEHGHHETEIPENEVPGGSAEMQIEAKGRCVDASCSRSDWMCRPGETLVASNKDTSLLTSSLQNLLKTSSIEKSKHPNKVSGSHQAILVSNVTKSNDVDAAYGHDKLRCTSDGGLQMFSVQASPDNTSLLNHIRRPTNPGFADMDLQSLFEVDELHDKELEEAQDHRHRCEIEERNALKAYRKAQRALAAANARCSYLYRRRELFAAELHSVLMEGSNLWLSRQHGHVGDEWNFFNNFSEVNADLIPASSNQMQTEFDAGNQVGNDSNVQSADGNAHHRFSPNVDGHNFGSEACSELDASTSDLLPCKDSGPLNGVLSPSNDPNMSAEEDEETFPFDHPCGQANAEFLRKKNNFQEKEKGLGGNPIMDLSVDGTRDPLLLEAELRSRLVSRLGMSNSSKRNVYTAEAAGKRTAEDDIRSNRTEMIMENSSLSNQASGFDSEKAAKNDVASMRNQMIVENVSVSHQEESRITAFGGSQETEGTIAKPSFGVKNRQQVEERSLNYSPDFAADVEDSAPSTGGCQSMSIALSSPILKSVFYKKVASAVSSSHLQIVNQNIGTVDMCADESSLMMSGDNALSIEIGNCFEEVVRDGLLGRIDSYTYGSTIDPFWPLCMYELRGKCNDDECPWQHSKDYSRIKLNQHDSPEGADLQGGLSSHCQRQKCGTQSSSVSTAPTYFVCFDTLKADSSSQGSLLSQKLRPSWRNIFSSCLVVSSSLPRRMPTEEPFLHGNDNAIEIRGNFNRQSPYFQSRNSTMGLLGYGFVDKDQLLETALLILNQEVKKVEGVKKSLAILSRALEADSQSLYLWIVYLHIYYGDKDSTGEDDLFSCAVQHNEGSYELWLMYINSRRQLNDRFAVYERAISSLCHHPCASDKDVVHASACILDLFLQMLNCYGVSGNAAKATQRIYGLLYVESDSDESNSLLLSDILSYLTIPDKCVFWVCCLFFVIYGKLPEELVQQFEFKKDISPVGWPSVCLTKDKEQLFKLIGLAADSVKLDVDSVPLQNRVALRSVHLFALNHVKLVAAIDGVESCENLLERYTNWYPSCLELFLMSVQIRKSKSQSMRFLGFEEVLSNWQNEVPGVQCIWNQYGAYALQSGGFDKAKEIMVRWFSSSWKVQYSQSSLDEDHNDKKNGSADPLFELSSEAALSSSNKIDPMFALLNLSLYSLLESDPLNAHLAVNKALKISSHEDFRHCLGEHAMFLRNYGSQLGKDVSLHGKLGVLKSYLVHARELLYSEPLSRKFIQDIQKPRLRQLVNDIYSPVTPDFSLINLVLEIWFGPSLLPQKFSKFKDLVDFVEAILEISPSNYPLAISVCELHSQNSNATDAKSASISFWASSLLVNTIYQAIPVAPEHVWVQAAGLLGNLTGTQAILESFYGRALSVYPFSIRLWKSFLNTCTEESSRNKVVEAARERGIEIEQFQSNRSPS